MSLILCRTCSNHSSCFIFPNEKQLVKTIRELEAKYKHPICILADLQGPKLRVGVFEKDSVRLLCCSAILLEYAVNKQCHFYITLCIDYCVVVFPTYC